MIATVGWFIAALLAALLVQWHRRFRLVARAEHELRSALHALALASDSIGRSAGKTPTSRMIDAQLRRAKAGLDDLATVRTGLVSKRRTIELPLDAALNDSTAAWREVAKRQGRSLRVAVHGGVEPIEIESGRLDQIVGNLVANAIEHGRGVIDVEGHLENGIAQIRVRDDGPGPVRIPRRSPLRRRTGRGLGLGIVAREARNAGGRLAVLDREPGVLVEFPARTSRP